MSALCARNSCGWSPEMLDRRSEARRVERLRRGDRGARRGGGRRGRGSSSSRPPRGRAAPGPAPPRRRPPRARRRARRSSSSRKRSTGSTSATSGRSAASVAGGDLGQLAVLGAELGGRRDLHALGLLERALGEGGEPGQALDLDVEQLAADRALLGGRVDVEDVAADGELAALLDLVDALVAAGHELRRAVSSRSSSPPFSISKPCGRRAGSGTFSASAAAAATSTAGCSWSEQRVERGDAQADQVRRRGEVRLVAHAARRVEAHRPRRQEGPQVGGEVAGGAVVAGDHQRRAVGLGVEQRGEQVGAQARGHEGALRLLARRVGERGDARRRRGRI